MPPLCFCPDIWGDICSNPFPPRFIDPAQVILKSGGITELRMLEVRTDPLWQLRQLAQMTDRRLLELLAVVNKALPMWLHGTTQHQPPPQPEPPKSAEQGHVTADLASTARRR